MWGNIDTVRSHVRIGIAQAWGQDVSLEAAKLTTSTAERPVARCMLITGHYGLLTVVIKL